MGSGVWRWLVVAAAVGLVVLVALTTSRFWYTPTTTASVVNDTSRTVALDNCDDALVVIGPGQTSGVAPFSHGTPGCTVFVGRTDLGGPSGCLVFPMRQGAVIRGSTVRVSSARPMPDRSCQA